MAYDKRYVSGGMNMDDALEVLSNGSVRFAKNMLIRNGKRENIKGSSLVTNIDIPFEPFGTYKCIGAKEDPISNTVIYFLHHSGLDHRILQYNNKANSILTVLREQPIGCLNFDTNFLITGINIIYIDVDNPLLYWTDNKNRPRELNIEKAKLFSSGDFSSYYSNPFLETFIDAIKYPPIYAPTFVYSTDTSRITNDLKNIMFEFQYRYVYFNYQYSAYSPISEVTRAPQYSNLYLYPIADDLENNRLEISGVQGASNVIKIEIAMRIGNIGAFYTIATLDRAIGTVTDAPFTYNFYNDQVKLPINIKDSIKLFDSVPQLAQAQDYIKGNRLIYGNIVDGYDNVPVDVELTPIYNARPVAGLLSPMPTLSFSSQKIQNPPVFGSNNADLNTEDGIVNYYTLDFGGYTPVIGDVVKIDFDYSYVIGWNITAPLISGNTREWTYPDFRSGGNGRKIMATTMVKEVGGVAESLSDILDRLTESLNTTYSYLNPYYQGENLATAYSDIFVTQEIHNQGSGDQDNTQGNRLFMRDGDTIIMADSTHDTAQVDPEKLIEATIAGVVAVAALIAYYALQVTDLTSNTEDNRSTITTPTFTDYTSFKAGALHQFGIVYRDNAGRMGGTNVGDGTIVSVEWYNSASDTGKVDIGWKVKNLPPDWAVSWGWVYAGSSIGDFYQLPITKTITFVSFFGGVTTYPYNGDNFLLSYEEIFDYAKAVRTTNPILGNEAGNNLSYQWSKGDRIRLIGQTESAFTPPTIYVDAEIIGVDIIDGVNYLIIRQKIGDSGFVQPNVMVEIYRNKENSNAKLYYEFGQQYQVGNPGLPNRYHQGEIQDQDPNQPSTIPATGIFTKGDVYFKERIVAGSFGTSVIYVEDYYWLDYAPTNNYNRGRPERVLEGANLRSRKTTMIPFSGRFIENSNINNLNSFYDTDFEEYETKYGSIQKFAAREEGLIMYQELKVGNIPINERLVVSEGSQILAQTDNVLNPIRYYAGDFGIGTNPECWARFGYADYFVDVFRGVICRLSLNGIDSISYLYKMNDYTTALFKQISGQNERVNIYGVFNKQRMQYEIAIDGSQTSGVIDSVTLAFDEKNNVFSTFLDYLPEMFCSSNQNIVAFKSGKIWTHETNTLYNNFFGVQYNSDIWVVGNIEPSEEKTFSNISIEANSIFSVPEFTNNKGQLSNLIDSDFEVYEGIYYAKILYDTTTPNEPNPLINGDTMRDVLIVAKLRSVLSSFVSLFAVNFNSDYSARSNK